MNTREQITPSDTLTDIIVKMSDNNIGAQNVLMGILKKNGAAGLMDILSLDDMNIRGTQIWVGYKDHCKEDLNAFITAIKNRDAKMVETINRVGRQGNHPHKAVTRGGSSNREML